MNRLRTPFLLVLVVVLALPLSACSSAIAGRPVAAVHIEHRGPAGVVQAGLERFYGQALKWSGCTGFATTAEDTRAYSDAALQCTYLQVPLDYAQPAGRTIMIGLLRRPATDSGRRIGSMVINPGGPGGSGMRTAAGLVPTVVGNELGARLDLVGFDPRGIGASQPPVRCLTGPERDVDRLDLDVDTSPAGVAQTESEERDQAAKCAARSGVDVLAHVGTREVAKDLDVLRSALGDAKLTYVGFSYGTRLGSGYAEDFPGNVRAMVLDGALDPNQDPVNEEVAQAKGFEQAFEAFAVWCAKRPDCALGRDPAQAVPVFRGLVLPLIDKPAAVRGGRQLSYPDATTGVIQALYSPELWVGLNKGLELLGHGNGDVIMLLADLYDGRGPDGSYSNELDAFTAVRCVDDPRVTDPVVLREANARYRAAAPFLDDGHGPSSARDVCAFWPVPNTGMPHRPKVAGLPPVVVVSTLGDPATPYQAGVDIAAALRGRLLTVEGDKHTAFLQGNSCVDRAGAAYLTDLTLPAEGLRCSAA